MNDSKIEQQRILKVLDFLEDSANKADPSIAEPYLMLEDPRFCEIEDFLPEPFKADTLREIHAWIRAESN